MISFALKLLARNRLSVFLFHKVPQTPDPLLPQDFALPEFSRQIDFIAEHFDVLPMDDAVLGLQGGTLPRRAACITFDDGYPDWTERALPVLQSRGVHATFYITTGQFGAAPMWHERIANAIRHTSMESLVLEEYGLGRLSLADMEARRCAISCIEHHLKYQTVEFRDEVIDVIETACAADPTRIPRMREDEVRRIHSLGYGIGAHTVTHPILNLCSRREAMHEIGAVREQLESMIGGSVRSFAYPNGIPRVDFSEQHVAMAKQAGYAHAVTTHWGAARSGDSVFQIPRFTPWGPDSLRMQLQMLRNLMIPSTSLSEQ